MKKYGRVIQEHHIDYEKDITTPLFKGEHELITKMHRYSKRTVSLQFLELLRLFIFTSHRDNKVVDLEKE